MAGMGDRLWDIGRSPAQHMTVLVFGLFGLLCNPRGHGEDGWQKVADHLPRFAFVAARKELPRVRPGVAPDGIRLIDGHSFPENPKVSARAGQTLRGTSPRFAPVRRLPDGHLPFREHAVPSADQRRHERGVLLPWMHGDWKSEIGRQAFRDFRPFPTVRSAMVGPTVILLEEGAVPGGIPGELVHALAPLRVFVREELCPHAAVLHRPAASAIPRLERSDGTDSHDEMPRVPRVDEHGAEAQPPATWLPLLPRRMIVQRTQIVPRVPAGVAAEQGRGLGARVTHAAFLDRPSHVNHRRRWGGCGRHLWDSVSIPAKMLG